ncbi:hypothetical protein CCACVL1_15178 [Corchorus capsularis]|uniref:F-box domain-containing protein n=1 Tax=Corchorus capsularis TaxID=210143 RepID=A0A1R3I3N6_COCAP|nr:hypothetical protein CCACVL1_15178 [Corchorus capsularis]
MDRLSDLPDCILLHILSFLPETRRCVQTTLLSKRWNNLWTSVPDLIFRGYEESRNAHALKKFVRHVLSRRQNLPLNKLYLKYHGKDKSFITRIIKYAISHNVQHFSLYLQKQKQSGLYQESASLESLLPLFNICGSLKTLDLVAFSDIHLLEDFTLPNLTSVRLCQCNFRNGSDVESTSIDPFVGLFNLNSLQLVSCYVCGKFPKLKISGPQLHSLTISGYSDYNEVEVIAPKLQILSLDSLWGFSHLDFPLLEMVEPLSGILCLPRPPIDNDKFGRLYNAKALVLSLDIIMGLMEYLDLVKDQSYSSPFVRLTTLKVRCPPHLMMSSFNVPDNIIKYFGDNVTVKSAANRAVDLLRGELQQVIKECDDHFTASPV